MDLTKIFSGMDKGPEAIQANFEKLGAMTGLTKIPDSQWVTNGVTIDKNWYFRGISIMKLGDNALAIVNMQFTTTAQLNTGWNAIVSFPTSYTNEYLGSGPSIALVSNISDSDKVGDVGIDRGKGQVTIYVGNTIPSGTTINVKGIILLSKDTPLLN
ncbi:hypothetical protein [Limosilactobacillus mucosae]|uniref:hypothetical protein n=1 Tax=Limosilactobacillus mucosae TaxID=97478 RepID=UPI000888677D|nr:hypothetical protein [Limosilactobacillus mucosae]SDN54906.1 hypothetical protein SAMN05216430_10864 [Limosilactobacillus mucosae]SEL10298.1 hypothetical protein SAMN05216545_10937 [Limosilactobacillus mucosae]SFK23512.1 hypothetical protein SAMN05216461_10837 [Limosilactobacillus mucosae]